MDSSERRGAVSGETTPSISYLICATPRSGSTLLSQALRDTGIAGCPEEHFEVLLETGRPRQPRDYFQRSNDPEVWALLDDPEFRGVLGEYGGRYAEHPAQRDPSWRPPDFEGLLEGALRAGTTENGVMGTKIMWAYFRDFVRLARRTPGLEGIRPCDVPAAVLPNLRWFVWIRRDDTTRQAVSLWKALQTQQWRQDSHEEVGGQGLRFSFAAIDHLKLRIDEHNAAWQAYFERCSVEPLRIVYEEFVESYADSVLGLLRALDVTLPEGFTVTQPMMKRQADELSEKWVRLYNERKVAGASGPPGKV
jgi:trehalose 2-sulfotransferase